MAMPAPTEWTLEMLHALPDDGKRYELADGALLVSPSPSMDHQRVVAELHLLLAPWSRQHALEVFVAPSAITFSDRRELQPDLYVVPFRDGQRIHDPRDLTRLVLAIEVLSPATARQDRVTKRQVYLDEGVAEYWIVDLDARAVERWSLTEPRPEVHAGSFAWRPPGSEHELAIDVMAFFERALD